MADDFEPVRRLVSLLLEKRPELQIIGEASDGLEAVRKAQELNPDLILLDVSLPKLGGIDAARQMLTFAPKSKILFLSQETSANVVQAALNAGAKGYVVKTDAAAELLDAVEAVLEGKQFISSGLAGHDSRER